MKIIKGRISINKTGMSSNPKDTSFVIDITDANSAICILRLELDIVNYGMLISGSSERNCNIKYFISEENIKHLGKFIDCKEIFLPGFNAYSYGNNKSTEKELNKLVEPYLIDGWLISSLGLNTQQNDPRGYRVILKRFTDTEIYDE